MIVSRARDYSVCIIRKLCGKFTATRGFLVIYVKYLFVKICINFEREYSFFFWLRSAMISLFLFVGP